MNQKEIGFSDEKFLEFPTIPDGTKNLLIIGSWNNLCGVLDEQPNGRYKLPTNMGAFTTNIGSIVLYLKKRNFLTLYCEKNTIDYFCRLITALEDNGIFKKEGIDDIFKYVHGNSFDEQKDSHDKIMKWLNRREEKGMKFDMIIQNPPYKGSLHLEFLEKGLNVLNKNGKMVIVEPATWLINVRKNGKASRYDEIKKKIEGHVESVVIENLNNEFGIRQQVPFATTTIDTSKTFDKIDFKCFGEHRIVTSIYDCNMIGDYNTIQSILSKCKNFGGVMDEHVVKQKIGDGVFYVKCASDILGGGLCSDGKRALSDATYQEINNGFYHINYVGSCYHTKSGNGIVDMPFEKNDCNGNKIQGEIGGNIYGTKEELENWKHFVFNNKLPLFLNIVLTIDQNNNSKEFVPWLVDKQYTDDEINKLFGFTEEEIRLMDVTLKKYERNSPWFRRYMCGKDSATDEEVNEFIKRISE